MNAVSRWYSLELTDFVVFAMKTAPLPKPVMTLLTETPTLGWFSRLLTPTLWTDRPTTPLLTILLTGGATRTPIDPLA